MIHDFDLCRFYLGNDEIKEIYAVTSSFTPFYKKIRDHENNSGWIHVSQLSKKKAGITNVDELLVFKKPTLYSKPLVILSKGRLCFIKKCKNEWCKIETGEFIGWIMRKNLWGRI